MFKKLKFVPYFVILVLSFVILSAGCQTASTTSTSNALTNTAGESFASTGAGLANSVNESMGVWAGSGSVSSGVTTAGIKSASVKAQTTTVTGPDANGYYHITQEVSSTIGTTYEADLFIRLVTNEAGLVTDVYLYGSYGYSYSGASSFSYTETFGSASSPYHGSATWSGSTLTSIAASGTIIFNISTSSASAGDHTIAMTFTISSYSLPVTAGADDYPTGTISIVTTYDGVSQPTMSITFNGTATASFTYGDYSSTISVAPA
ncbi:hypothetical protein A2625_01130 [candidate division WOR-1 bacterium RIFCSPHIGHO2_01_FULL_53_15]|uniref:CBM-cenC domain-containing protein n=1 Tax=candidate division WOR-1 bacterium RIFCSPHIGHO2_01_FULL_53_15 TaxID=1802564 RepID=A0A1F4Q0Q8_UNCSA|nr:MAG: hypothetical protein A2625_01130 [candidate division WOR-1 bacterium RIFCSPHIGHO2_01_FULL_53_15]OGC10751.1 MAG: hypothetical protein A3D23_04640 [candidate division WOR-1 bacterium RIFCSPHIGHO2_02_FULL_53_26]